MADSPPYSDAPGAAPGGDLNAPRGAEQFAENDGPPGTFAPGQAATPDQLASWSASPPWWTRDGDQAVPGNASGEPPSGTEFESDIKVAPLSPESQGAGTGPHRLPAQPGGTGPHALPVPPDGSGPHRFPVSSTGTGPHALPRMNGTGPQVLPIPPDGTGPQIAVQGLPSWGGTGQAPPGPAQAPGKGRKPLNGLLLGAGVGAVLVIVLMGGVLAFKKGGDTSTGSAQILASKKRISTPVVAGGLRRDVAAPATSAAYPFVAAGVMAGGVPTAKNGTAVYTDAPNGTQNILFMGGTGRVGDPAAFLQKTRPTTYISAENTAPGKGEGKAACGTFAVLSEVHLFCSWATRDSYGIIASDTPMQAVRTAQIPQNGQVPQAGQPPQAGQAAQTVAMGDLMRRMRADLEKPR